MSLNSEQINIYHIFSNLPIVKNQKLYLSSNKTNFIEKQWSTVGSNFLWKIFSCELINNISKRVMSSAFNKVLICVRHWKILNFIFLQPHGQRSDSVHLLRNWIYKWKTYLSKCMYPMRAIVGSNSNVHT